MTSIHPELLLTCNRFDVVVKYLYAKSILNGFGTNFYKEMYRQHLKCWNNFKEYDDPTKNSFEVYDSRFKKLVIDVSEHGFDVSKSSIFVENNKHLLNGSHRVAATLAANKNITYQPGLDGKDGQRCCDYSMFAKLGLNSVYMDRVAIEFAKLKRNTLTVCLFPACNGNLPEIINLINNYSSIFYHKNVKLCENGAFNLMRELYLGEEWAGTWGNNYNGYREKAKFCFPGRDYEMNVFLIEIPEVDAAITLKGEIRSIFNVGKHSVHINDTHEQTVRISKTIFNDNSIHFLCKSKTNNFKLFKSMMNEYNALLSVVDRDNYCVTASGSLASYGLRDVDDIDYLHNGEKLPVIAKISSHNEYGVNLYDQPAETIVNDPRYHYYHRGLKFTSLDQVKKLKQKRNESKDVRDIVFINSV